MVIGGKLRRTYRSVLPVEVKPFGDVVVFAPSGEPCAPGSFTGDAETSTFPEQDRMESQPPITPALHFISGETQLVLGKPYRLETRRRFDLPQPSPGKNCPKEVSSRAAMLRDVTSRNLQQHVTEEEDPYRHSRRRRG